MKIACYARDGAARIGILDGAAVPTDSAVVEVADHDGTWSVPATADGPRFELKELRLLPAVPRPGKILAVGRNYGAHLEEGQRLWAERGRDVVRPPFPSGFVKVASGLVADGEPIVIPRGITTVDYEVELAVVIGRRALDVGVDEALSYVAGYTVANDVAAREIQIPEMEQLGLLVSKNFPSFAPLGPWVVTADEIPDPQDLQLSLTVNGEVRQSASTADMLFSVAEVIAAWSRMGLDPGDVILTGTPSGVALSRAEPDDFYLRPGDVVRATIERIGTLENPVSA
jgi:2-keto-4-pentenoate hydratase/2-oxohepta-3-ene-1,7-dioic acid hydratase in catechol pathway